ncbi:MAG: hypothetical protein HOV68_20875 [Streptomycetaceae bacterium]|nr:hypothetical protein [Streptomycetaceae bacterium]
MIRVDPAALRAASDSARQLSDQLPRMSDAVTASAQDAASSCPGFITATALVEVADAWRARLAAVGGAFAQTAANLATTADRDEATDRAQAAVYQAAAH